MEENCTSEKLLYPQQATDVSSQKIPMLRIYSFEK
jgi:hypothetical protein